MSRTTDRAEIGGKNVFRDRAGKKRAAFLWAVTQNAPEKSWRSHFHPEGRRTKEDEGAGSYPQTAGVKTTANH